MDQFRLISVPQQTNPQPTAFLYLLESSLDSRILATVTKRYDFFKLFMTILMYKIKL